MNDSPARHFSNILNADPGGRQKLL